MCLNKLNPEVNNNLIAYISLINNAVLAKLRVQNCLKSAAAGAVPLDWIDFAGAQLSVENNIKPNKIPHIGYPRVAIGYSLADPNLC